MNVLNFHVRHEVTPERTWEVIVAIAEGNSFNHVIQADRQAGRMRQLGLLEKSSNRLTDVGVQLYRMGVQKRSVAMDLLHYLHYSLWKPDKPLENTLSWSYRTYCEILFEQKECVLDLSARESFTADLNNKIVDFFGIQLTQTKKGSVSLSTNSLTGIHHWLAVLDPPAIVEEKYSRRLFCSPELLLMAISWMSLSSGMGLDADLLLTTENRSVICGICLLQLTAFDRVLDWAISLYPALIQPGTRTGSYGRFIRLNKLPQWDDLLAEEE